MKKLVKLTDKINNSIKKKNIKLFITSLLVFVVTQMQLHGQRDYKNSIGVRVAPSSGLSFKHFMSEKSAFEGIFSTRWSGINLTGLYQINQNAFGTENLNFFYGFGGHVGFWDGKKDHPWFDDQDTHVLAGIDGIIGLELTFESIPFSMSLDWKPAFNIGSYTGFWTDEIGLSLRYVIN